MLIVLIGSPSLPVHYRTEHVFSVKSVTQCHLLCLLILLELPTTPLVELPVIYTLLGFFILLLDPNITIITEKPAMNLLFYNFPVAPASRSDICGSHMSPTILMTFPTSLPNESMKLNLI